MPLDVGVFPEDQVIDRLGGMVLAHNLFPYPNAAVQLLIFTERHLDDISQMTSQDMTALWDLFAIARANYAPTGCLFMRYSIEGNYSATEATVLHPHAQIVVPQLDPETEAPASH